jgi:hypothetical protein
MSKEIQLSLTKENSHNISLPLGQGSLSIGNIGMDKKLYDVLVDENLPINWDTFNTHFTGSGLENKELYPFGDWPRFFHYSGDDIGFIKWTEKRKTEDFSWTPQKSTKADFTNVNIRHLKIQSKNVKINLKLGKNITQFSISGDIENFNIQSNDGITSLNIYPTVSKNKKYQLPKLDQLKDITSLDISTNPLDQPIDCQNLLQFQNLTNLSLSGNLTNLDCLKNLEKLERLAIRYAPNLENLPKLSSWKKLTSFIGWNIEETNGKLLRTELKSLSKERELEYSTVSQLRKLIWFTTEYGIPFSAWEGKNAKTAVKNYKATLKKLKKVKTEVEAKKALIEFTQTFNSLPQIETTEREDIGEAIEQLRQLPNFEIDSKKANKWFDEARDY